MFGKKEAAMKSSTHRQVFIYTTPTELVRISSELKEKFESGDAEKSVRIYAGEQTLIFIADDERIKSGE